VTGKGVKQNTPLRSLMTNQKSKNYSSINLEGRNVKITQSPFESETEELSRRMLCSRDHPRTRRRLPFLDSNNRHSLESRAAVSLDISVHAHDARFYRSRISCAEERKDSWESNNSTNA